MIGPIRGVIGIAPKMTAVELTLSPTYATTMANISTHGLVPSNRVFSRIVMSMTSGLAWSLCKLNSFFKFKITERFPLEAPIDE